MLLKTCVTDREVQAVKDAYVVKDGKVYRDSSFDGDTIVSQVFDRCLAQFFAGFGSHPLPTLCPADPPHHFEVYLSEPHKYLDRVSTMCDGTFQQVQAGKVRKRGLELKQQRRLKCLRRIFM